MSQSKYTKIKTEHKVLASQLLGINIYPFIHIGYTCFPGTETSKDSFMKTERSER